MSLEVAGDLLGVVVVAGDQLAAFVRCSTTMRRPDAWPTVRRHPIVGADAVQSGR